MSQFLDRTRFALDHRWAPEHLSVYLDEELAAGSRTRMERHVADCPECRRLLAEIRRILDGLRWLPAPGPGPDLRGFAAAVRGRLDGPAAP
jgi:anti-sigma factor RsiW